MKLLGFLLGLCALLVTMPAIAQDKSWLQIEAQPNLNTALDRARAYAALFPDVEGYRLRNGWYGIALGPSTTEDAATRLLDLRSQNLIPSDSYLSDGATYTERFWPVGLDATALPTEPAAAPPPPTEDIQTGAIDAPPDAATEPAQPEADEPEPAPPEPAPPPETLSESTAAETALTGIEREFLQEALQWYGYYEGGLDGSFGKGTRASFAAWQAANGFEETGVLSSYQRQQLTDGYVNDKAAFGFQTVTETESGIEITLPMALIQFDRYEPPFVQYTDKDSSGLKVMLISEPGGPSGLKGLYDILQTLEIVPPEGERSLGEDSFTIKGRNDQSETLAFAKASGGNIKGYLVSWNLADADRMTRILPVLKSSFRSLSDQVLDPGLVPLSEAVRRGLLAGLDVRHPKFSRSGFFVSAEGKVLTTSQAVQGCGRVMLARSTEATVTYTDEALGIALLTPNVALAPRGVASFAGSGNPGSRVSLSGYSYEDKLPAPVITLGVLEEAQGLNGEPNLTRLSLTALPGDSGGPVLDGTGAVLGMLLAPDAAGGKQLPKGVAFAASAAALTAVLTAQGVIPAQSYAAVAATPDAMANLARDMTVLVSCWE